MGVSLVRIELICLLKKSRTDFFNPLTAIPEKVFLCDYREATKKMAAGGGRKEKTIKKR
jgi:hypothetical protein